MPRWPSDQTVELTCDCGRSFRISRSRNDRKRFCSRECFFKSERFNPGNMLGATQKKEHVEKRASKNRGMKRSGAALENIRMANANPTNRLRGADHPAWKPDSAHRRAVKRACHGFIWNAIRAMPTYDADVIIPELGWSARQLQEHLESLFEEGMTWENHALKGWHIDHVRPISSFPIGTPLSVINELCNLRPLWACENLSKGGKWQQD